MPWTQKQMLRDANGDLIPQYWDVAEQEFKPLTGSDGANDVRITGRKVEEITVLDAESIASGDSALVSWAPFGELKDVDELWFALSNDQQPISIRFRSFWGTVLTSRVFFPDVDPITTTHTANHPFVAFYHRLINETMSDVWNIDNIVEAKMSTMPYEYGSPVVGRVYNLSQEIATITLKVYKVWR